MSKKSKTKAPLEPNSPEWLARLKEINAPQAAIVERLSEEHEDTKFCSVCGEDTVNTFKADHVPLLLRFCDDCKTMQESLYDYGLTAVEAAS